VDVDISALKKQINDLINDTIALNNRIRKLETDNSNLISENLSLKDSLSKKAAEIKILVKDTAILKETIRADRIIIANKTREYDELQSRYDKLLDKYNDLLNKEKTIRKDIADSIRGVQYPPSACPMIDTKNSLQLTIYYTRNQTYYPSIQPEKINIYLIPYTNDNIQTIRRAKVYDYYNFDEPALEKAGKKALYCNGNYYFSNVSPGKYLVKVCTLYGAYKDYKVEKGNERLIMDAVPPVR
jgi:regulator of replication initiation timing